MGLARKALFPNTLSLGRKAIDLPEESFAIGGRHLKKNLLGRADGLGQGVTMVIGSAATQPILRARPAHKATP